MSIIDDIYNGRYHPQENRAHYPQELRDKDMEFWNKVSETLGDDVVDAHLYKLSEKEKITDIHLFREGFRLGVLMMLEVFGEG